MLQKHKTFQLALCLVGCLHLASFASLWAQNCYLFGKDGVQPVSAFLQQAAEQVLPDGSSYEQNIWRMFSSHPTLLWLHPVIGVSAGMLLNLVCMAGLIASFTAACGVQHPLTFAVLWALHLSVVNVGQAFLPQPGDTVLLELTFVSIWLAHCLPSLQQAATHSLDPQQPQQQLCLSTQALRAHPATLFTWWLLFKVLLLSSSSKTNIVCSAVRGVTNCYRAMISHGQPNVFSWWLQSSANPLPPALSLLEGLAAFIVLCPSPVVQQLTAKLLLSAQLLKACLGTMTLVDAAVALLCITLMNDGMVVGALQRVKELYASKRPAAPDEGEAAAIDAAAAEVLAYKPNGNHKRSPSADSLASLLSEPDLQPTANPRVSLQQAGLLSSRTNKALLGIAAVYLALMLSSDAAGYTVLRWTPEQITAVLRVLVPSAATLWLAKLAYAAWQSCKQAVAEAAVMGASKAAKGGVTTRAKAPAGSSASAATPISKLRANGITGDLTSPQLVTTEAAGLDSVQASLPAIATKAPPDADMQAAKPARRVRAASAKAASDTGTPKGTPRKSSRSKAASQDDSEAPEAAAEDSAATGTPKATRARRTTAARSRKAVAATAPIAEEAEGATFFTPEPAVPAADTPAAAAPETPAVPATPLTAARPPATAAQNKAVVPAAGAAREAFDLSSWLEPKLHIARVVMPSGVLLLLFLAGLPAVLVPAGYTQQSFQSIPGLFSSYQFARDLGMVSSDASLRASLEVTAVAAQLLPGSHLVFQFSTSEDNVTWQPVVFKQGLTTDGPGLDSLRGLYEPRLQGRLLAAGTGDITDNMWLLNLADKILEGAAELNAVLAQPAALHEFIKIDLMSYTPSSVVASSQPASVSESSSRWVVQRVAPVLPAMPRGHQDVKEALAELHWGAPSSGSACTGRVLGVPPQVLIPVLLLAVVAWHVLVSGGLLHDLTGMTAGVGGRT